MPDHAQAARAAAIADLVGPLAVVDLAIAIDDPARPDWVCVLGHLRHLYGAAQHTLLTSAIDVYIDGHPLPRRTVPALHRAHAALYLHRMARLRPALVAPLAVALTALWGSDDPGARQLAAIAAHGQAVAG